MAQDSRLDQRPRLQAAMVWLIGVIVVAVCGLATVSGHVTLLVLPTNMPPPASGAGPRQGSGVNSWDIVTGSKPSELMNNWIGVVIVIFGAGCVIALLTLGAFRLRARVTLRRAEAEPAAPTPTFDRVAASREVSDAVSQALVELDHDVRLNDAIIACWQAFLVAARDGGLPRTASETSTDYVRRLTVGLRIDGESLQILAGLYREARFSDHELAASARNAARTVLQDIQRDLAGQHVRESARG